jgi:hypothetical protein
LFGDAGVALSRKAKLIAVIVALCVAAMGLAWIKYWLSVDECLDSGGRWDYDAKECDQ